MRMACEVFFGQPGRSAARKSDAYSLAPVTLATPSMRPTPVAAGFQPCRPGRVSRAVNPSSSAYAKRDRLSAMPLAVANLTNSRRELHMLLTSWSAAGHECGSTNRNCARWTSASQLPAHMGSSSTELGGIRKTLCREFFNKTDHFICKFRTNQRTGPNSVSLADLIKYNRILAEILAKILAK